MNPLFYYALVLTAVIVIHESGHYFFARLFGVSVQRASLFFNPFFTFLKYNPLTGRLDIISTKSYWREKGDTGNVMEATESKLSIRITRPLNVVFARDKKSEKWRLAKRIEVNTVVIGKPYAEQISRWRLTQYCIGWLPCGGYVTLKNDYSPQGILSKKNHQQFLIHFGGICFNIITMLAAMLLLRLDYQYQWGNIIIETHLYYFSFVTFILAAFNILPLPGLDGAGMLLSILNYVLPEKAQSVVRVVNNLLGILVFIYIFSSWFRRSFGFEQHFWHYVVDCFDAFERLIIM